VKPSTFALAGHEIHAWRVDLSSASSRRVKGLRHILAEDERRRADGFCFEEDRERFVVARGVLRSLLGSYLDLEPGRLNFRYGSHGKPALAEGTGGDTLRFNVSHSRGLALFALTRNREVGIDVEYVRSDLELEEIAGRYFSPQEAAALRSLPTDARTEAFFACWTRKEAYLKARGEGLSIALDGFSVSLVPGEPAVVLNTQEGPSEAARWALRELRPGPGYVAALAAEGHGWRLVCRHWPEEE
jgi:4'-phosphopantetheinyl transferase